MDLVADSILPMTTHLRRGIVPGNPPTWNERDEQLSRIRSNAVKYVANARVFTEANQNSPDSCDAICRSWFGSSQGSACLTAAIVMYSWDLNPTTKSYALRALVRSFFRTSLFARSLPNQLRRVNRAREILNQQPGPVVVLSKVGTGLREKVPLPLGQLIYDAPEIVTNWSYDTTL